MISMVLPLSAGNAVRIYLTPEKGACRWTLLRRLTDDFTGPADPGAVAVLVNSRDLAPTDVECLENGTSYTYRVWEFNGDGDQIATSALAGVPNATYSGNECDPQAIVLHRIELGLAVEVSRGALQPASGKIPVLRAPFALNTPSFPVVSVHLESTAPSDRLVGEMVLPDVDLPGGIGESDGWYARTQLNIVAVSQNADERMALRRALARIIQANLTVFDALGLLQIDFSQSDTEQFTEQNVPFYITSGTFSCLSPLYVADQDAPVVTDLTVSASAFEEFANV